MGFPPPRQLRSRVAVAAPAFIRAAGSTAGAAGISAAYRTGTGRMAAMSGTAAGAVAGHLPPDTDLIEWYYERGWTDGLPVVPPTRGKIDAMVAALGGEPELLECRVPPRYGSLTREVLAVNLVMAGCKPEYAPVVRAALLALTQPAFNLNGVQATTHMAAPLLVVNGPIAR